MNSRWHILAWLLPLPLLCWIGHGLLFTSFMLYDDEGYILLSLRNFSAHGGLYDRVYSQYGPFFYAALDGISSLLRFEWNNTSGRWFTLFNWLGASSFCGLLVWRAARSWPAALYALVGSFSLLWIMLQEPVHPGGLITLLVALAAWAGAEAILADRPERLAWLCGGLGALVALTKINAGAFLVLSTGLWLLTGLRVGRATDAVRLVAFATAALLPFVLMRSLMDRPWVPTYALLAAISGLSAMLVCSHDPTRVNRSRDLLLFAGAGVLATTLVAVWSLATGTTLLGLLHGVVLDPLRHPGIYAFPVRWRPAVVPVAIAGLALVCAWRWRPHARSLLTAIALLRFVVAGGFAVALLPWIGTSQAALALCYGVPLAALFAVPLRPGENPRESRVPAWLAILLVLQALQAFPIAGSQLNWGTFLWVSLLALGVADAVAFFRIRTPRGALFASIFACAFAALQLAQLVRVTREREADGFSLALPGAQEVRLPAAIASALHVMSVNARAHSDVLFSLPGAFSYNLWAERPAPTLRNVTHWFSLLPESEQLEIIESLNAAERPAFVLQRPQLVYLAENGFPVRGPLVGHLRHDYHEVLRLDAYSLWVRKGRAIRPFGILERIPRHDAEDGNWRLTARIAPGGEEILGIEVMDTRLPAPSPATPARSLNLAAGGADDPEGRPATDLPTATFPLPPADACRIAFDWDGPAGADEARHHVFRLYGRGGRTVAYARFAEPIP